MPMPANQPGAATQPSTAYRDVLYGDLPCGLVRAGRPPRMVPHLSEYDPAEERIREQLLEMGGHPLGGSAGGRLYAMGLVQL
ncbi:hypothetical protein ACPXCO_23455 [Streptomyces cyaneofuscatus]|uniref:hypothetical protein n=1 Tax=Streptomyces cyaneofuscatus TaxID=66883 RepID=UPI003CF23834